VGHNRQIALDATKPVVVRCGMDIQPFDIVVIGAGIAGATCAAALAPTHRVALIEAEEAAGYHSTGRSAAIWFVNYGPPDVRALTALSRDFFENPPPGFTEHPLHRRRTMLFLAPAEQSEHYARLMAEGTGLREITVEQARGLLPALRRGFAKHAAVEEDAFDMDVGATHKGYLRQLRRLGGVLALRHRAGRITREAGRWHVETSEGAIFAAPVVIDAAGAWADEVAAQAGVATLGLTPCRRTASIIDPAPWAVEDWPLVNDVGHTWYVRPEARTRLLVSPADQTPMHPHDVQPDELDIAISIDRMQQALDIEVRRVERSWAGLRTFAPDGSLAIGFDTAAEGFLWCAGQGGYGIQTSPAAGRLVAALVRRENPGEAGAILQAIDPNRFRRAAPVPGDGGPAGEAGQRP
jgi:D-arginine dehydrogenase